MAYTTVNKSTLHFDTKLYTGNGSSQTITGLGFQPDVNWSRKRTSGNNHAMVDVVRGVTKTIYPDLTSAEGTQASGLTAFTSDGYSFGSSGEYNDNAVDYVSWNWKAGGTASSNSDGSVTSTVSANTTAKCSVVKYTNPSSGSPFTVGHGLGAAPKLIIVKNLTSSQTWGVYHASLGFGKYLRLDSTAGEAAANLVTATSSTTFSTYYDHHSAGNELVAYCYADNPGFFKAGVYTGNAVNGGTTAPFIYTGFKPSWVVIKTNSTAGAWLIVDNKRSTANGFNLINKGTEIENSAEQGADFLDFYSNGFKIQTSDVRINNNNTAHYWWAFGQTLVGSNNIPATAR